MNVKVLTISVLIKVLILLGDEYFLVFSLDLFSVVALKVNKKQVKYIKLVKSTL